MFVVIYACVWLFLMQFTTRLCFVHMHDIHVHKYAEWFSFVSLMVRRNGSYRCTVCTPLAKEKAKNLRLSKWFFFCIWFWLIFIFSRILCDENQMHWHRLRCLTYWSFCLHSINDCMGPLMFAHRCISFTFFNLHLQQFLWMLILWMKDFGSFHRIYPLNSTK